MYSPSCDWICFDRFSSYMVVSMCWYFSRAKALNRSFARSANDELISPDSDSTSGGRNTRFPMWFAASGYFSTCFILYASPKSKITTLFCC